MTTRNEEICPAEALLKMLSGKWKLQIFRLAVQEPVRFSVLLRTLEGSNRQTISLALRDMEEQGLLHKITIQQKPLHIEYQLTEKGRSMIPIFRELERV